MKNIIKKNLDTIFVFVLIFFSQITIIVPNFVTSSMTKISVSDIIFALCLIYFIIYKLVIKRGFTSLSKSEKLVFWVCVALTLYFILAIPVRYLLYDKLTISITVIKIILWAGTIFFAIKQTKIAYNSLIKASAVFLTFMNLWCIVNILALNNYVRDTQILGTININVYVGYALLTSPVIISYFARIKKAHIFLSGLIISSVCILALSGSRVGLWMYLVEFTILIIVNRKQVNYLLKPLFVSCTIVVSVGLVGILHQISPAMRVDIERSFYYPITVLNSVFQADIEVDEESIVGDKPMSDEQLAVYHDDLSDPDAEDIVGSDTLFSLTRDRIYRKTFAVFEKYWLFGTGRHALYFTDWGYNSPHNYVFEILLYFGVVGSLIYLIFIFFPVYNAIRSAKKNIRYIYFLIGFGMVFIYSMVEPLLSDKILIIGTIWAVFSALYYQKIGNETK